jgi:hypothetical protein
MALGPFITYVPPNVYTRTLTETNVANLVGGVRIPVVIGVGQEELEQNDLEMVRGSSSNIDQQVTNEDVTESWVVDSTNPANLILGTQDGTRVTFRVRNRPIVDGQGFGRTTNDIRSVTVTVNGLPVALGGVRGADGLVTLQVPTQPTDVVRCTYYFHRGDTAFTDNVSNQVTVDNATLMSPGFEPFVISAGVNDSFQFNVNGTDYSLVLAAGSLTANGIKGLLDAMLIPNLSTSVFMDDEGRNHVQLTTTISLTIGSGTANGLLGWTANTTTNRNATFQVFNRPIVDGTGAGLTTTDTSKVVVKINNIQVIPLSVDGTNGTVTMSYAPPPGSTVTIGYWANTWQDTFDYLPNSLVTAVTRCGISPGRADYVQGTDFVVSNPSADVSIIHWGTSYVVAAAKTSVGSEPFDNTQIVASLMDDKMWLAECARVTDTTVIPALVSSTQFYLPEIPTTGNGRDTPLGTTTYNSVTNTRQDLTTNRPDLVVVRVGRSLRDALGRAAATVIAVDGASRVITLKDPVPPDYTAYATFYYNRITDNTFIFTCVTPGAVGSGQYTIFSSLTNTNLLQVKFGTKSGLSQTVQWPRGSELVPDAFHTGEGTPVSEIVTVTFGQSLATNAVFTNRGGEPYSFYTPYSATWVTKVNGVDQTTNLAAAAKAFLVGGHVVPIQTGIDAGKISIPASPGNVLNFVVDGVTLTANITAGNRTIAQILTDVNAAIDANPTFIGTAPNLLAGSVQIGPATGDVIFYIQSYSTPGVLPGGFDHAATVTINQGTVETVLGFRTYQTASGTPGAINKAATLLGTQVGNFIITAGLNDTFKFCMNGTDYQATLPAGGAVTPAAVIGAINAVAGLAGVSSVGTLANLNKIRLTSTINTDDSSLIILDGNANTVLGFTQNQQASQGRVSAQEVVDELMSTAGFIAGAVAYPATYNGKIYITFESLAVGAATSSIGFTMGTNSAFNVTTGIGITPGTDGDNGEDAYDMFTVSSNNAAGSDGTGIPGQTYTDARTGLRFTVLPAATGSYTPAGYFTLKVGPTFDVAPSIPLLAIGGVEFTVANTVAVAVDDTATLQTFDPGGMEPKVGDFYFVSYRYLKQDFSTRIFRQLKTIEANFGPTSAQNRVTLGAYLDILNGAILVGIKQVLKVPNTNQANDQDFITAIDDLATPLPGNIKPDIMVPLTNSTAVFSHLTQHCEIQANIRNQSERMGFIGFASGTDPITAQSVAKALLSNRMIAFYPDSSVITLTDELGQSFETLVDGSFFAAAVSGAVVAPSVDVATPYSRRKIQGFTRIPRIMDPVEANQTAVAGITILEDLDPIVRIRQGLTTNMSNVLTRLPTVTQIADYVQQQSRTSLDSFVGTKFLPTRTGEVVVSMTGLFKQLVAAEIVAAFTGLTASIDPEDPTILRFEAYYQPIFPLLYLVLTFNLRARI